MATSFSIKAPKDLPPKAIVLYRIRRKTDGRFSMGKNYHSFSPKGKLWTSGSVLKSHLTRMMTEHQNMLRHCRLNPKYNGNYNDKSFVYENCEIVEYILLEGTAIVASVRDCF